MMDHVPVGCHPLGQMTVEGLSSSSAPFLPVSCGCGCCPEDVTTMHFCVLRVRERGVGKVEVSHYYYDLADDS